MGKHGWYCHGALEMHRQGCLRWGLTRPWPFRAVRPPEQLACSLTLQSRKLSVSLALVTILFVLSWLHLLWKLCNCIWLGARNALFENSLPSLLPIPPFPLGVLRYQQQSTLPRKKDCFGRDERESEPERAQPLLEWRRTGKPGWLPGTQLFDEPFWSTVVFDRIWKVLRIAEEWVMLLF